MRPPRPKTKELQHGGFYCGNPRVFAIPVPETSVVSTGDYKGSSYSGGEGRASERCFSRCVRFPSFAIAITHVVLPYLGRWLWFSLFTFFGRSHRGFQLSNAIGPESEVRAGKRIDENRESVVLVFYKENFLAPLEGSEVPMVSIYNSEIINYGLFICPP